MDEAYELAIQNLKKALKAQMEFTEDLLNMEQCERYERKLYQIALEEVLMVIEPDDLKREQLRVFYLAQAEEKLNG